MMGVLFASTSVEPRDFLKTRSAGYDATGSLQHLKNYSFVNQCFSQNLEKDAANPVKEEDPGIRLPYPGSKVLEDIRQIEYSEIKYGEESTEYYGFIKGEIPILISAPHGTPHFRRRWNRWRGEDEYTSSLAVELGRLTGAHVLYVKNKAREDPNSDPMSRYKMAVAEAVKQYHIKFFLDLHGSDESRPYKIDIGIINDEAQKSSCPVFQKVLRESFSGFEPELFNKNFCAKDTRTLTSFARNELGIEAAQIEINAKYRIVQRKPDSSRARRGIDPHYQANPKDVLDFITKLNRAISKINERIKEGALARSGP